MPGPFPRVVPAGVEDDDLHGGRGSGHGVDHLVERQRAVLRVELRGRIGVHGQQEVRSLDLHAMPREEEQADIVRGEQTLKLAQLSVHVHSRGIRRDDDVKPVRFQLGRNILSVINRVLERAAALIRPVFDHEGGHTSLHIFLLIPASDNCPKRLSWCDLVARIIGRDARSMCAPHEFRAGKGDVHPALGFTQHSDDPLIRFRPRLELRDLDDCSFRPILNRSSAEKLSSIEVFANGYKLAHIGPVDFRIDDSSFELRAPDASTPEELADLWVRIRPSELASSFHLQFTSMTPRRMFEHGEAPDSRSGKA